MKQQINSGNRILNDDNYMTLLPKLKSYSQKLY
jgi:hypothetical protein